MSGPPPTLLDDGLLRRLEALWRVQGAPLVANLAPGLSEEQMDELAAPLGLRVPGEARTWWAWHNGVPRRAVEKEMEREMTGSGWVFLPLEEALEHTARWRSLERRVAADRAEPSSWRDSWLVIGDDFNGGVFACDCADRASAATPIYYVESQSGPERFEPRTRTFGEMVTWWIEYLESGAIAYDAAAGRWNYDFDRLDPERELTRLV